MNRPLSSAAFFTLAVLSFEVVTMLQAAAAADSKMPPVPAVSTFAPADDLLGQFDFYITRIEETLSAKEDYDEAASSRLKKDANTLAALALTLGMHDSDHRLKANSSAIVAGAQSMATAANFEAAQAALAALKQAVLANTPIQAALKWEHVASLEQLMKQVPTINATLKRGLTPARFKTLQKQSEGQAASLAAIAQTVMADTHLIKNRGDDEKWYQYCAEMRDAAGAVNAAIHADDQPATTAAMLRLTKSCETCHAEFRKSAE